MEHDGHRGSCTCSLISLFGAEDAPFCALVDYFVLKDKSAIVAHHFAAGFVASKVTTATFITLYDIFDQII